VKKRKSFLDFRTQSQDKIVTKKQGVKLASKIKAYKFIECSALTNEGIVELFDTINEIAFESKTHLKITKNRKCFKI
jgi:hypothetical protein